MTIFRSFTDAERAALKLHGLDTHRPSQLSDAFVLGMRYALSTPERVGLLGDGVPRPAPACSGAALEVPNAGRNTPKGGLTPRQRQLLEASVSEKYGTRASRFHHFTYKPLIEQGLVKWDREFYTDIDVRRLCITEAGLAVLSQGAST